MATIQEQLIQAIQTSGQSRYQVAMGSGVAQSQLSRLFSGETDLSTINIERILDHLGLEFTLTAKTHPRSK